MNTMPDALTAVTADRAAPLEICGGLTAAQWQAASGCIDSSVQNLVTRDAEALALAGTLRVLWL
jgi:hypothetical protein